jgi:rare lipoprotein A
MIITTSKIARYFSPSFLLVCQLSVLLLPDSDALARGQNYTPPPKKIQIGKASYYCQSFHGKKTSLGTVYNKNHWVAAHASFPFGTRVRVTHLGNRRQVEVRIVDRGPCRAQLQKGIIIDLSHAAAEKLGMIRQGKARVRLEVLKWGRSKKIIPEDHEENAVTKS